MELYLKKVTILFIVSFLLFNLFIINPGPLLSPYQASGLRYPTNTNLTTVDASFYGEALGDTAGESISISGDVNGDGFDDILIGAPNSYNIDHEGQAYLIFGKASGWSMGMNLSRADVKFFGEDSLDNAGRSVAIAGDVNGDGYDDILIGAHGNGRGGIFAGKTYLIFGKAEGWSKNVNLSDSDVNFIGEEMTDNSGRRVAGTGDVNGDGYDDFLISATGNRENGNSSGQVYLIFGRATGWLKDNDLSKVDASFLGESANDRAGSSMAGAGDINGDGYDDILIGSRNKENGINAGQTYLILGKSSGWAMDINLSNSDASYHGEFAGDFLGCSLIGTSIAISSLNGDEYDDIVIGADRNDEGGNNSGQTYIIFGKASGWVMDTNISSADASFIGEYPIDYAGGTVANAGDINRDGFDDIMIGAYSNNGLNRINQFYIIFGKVSGWSMDTNHSISDKSFYGDGSDIHHQQRLTGAGDVNGDGFDDIMRSVFPYTNYNDYYNGTIHLIFPELNDGPVEIFSVKTYSDISYSDEISLAEVNDRVYVELTGTDGNLTRVDHSFVNIISNGSPNGIRLKLVETGVNSGIYRGYFTISNRTNIGLKFIKASIEDYIHITSVDDATKNATILVSTSVQLRPLDDLTTVNEDDEYYVDYWVFGYNTVSQWTFSSNAFWLNWDAINHDIYGTPDNGNVGSFWVRINITDGLGNFDEHYFEIEVLNALPNITTEDITSALEDEFYYVDYNSSDDGQGIIIWDLNTNATWLDINSSSGVLSGTPTNDDRGSNWVNVTVDDGNSGYDWSNFTLNVLDVNDRPVITTEDILSVNEDEYYEVDYEAVDVDGITSLQWFLTTNALWLTIEKDKGILSGYPLNDHVGKSFVNVTVADSRGGSRSHNFTLEVNNTNDPPVWIDVPEYIEVNEGDLFRFDVNASDVDSTDTITYSIYSDDNIDIAIDPATGLIEWQTALENPLAPTLFIFDLSVTDKTLTIWKKFSITVIPNARPTVDLLAPYDGGLVSYSLSEFVWTGSDDENEELTYDIYIGKDLNTVTERQESVRVLNNTLNSSFSAVNLDIGRVYYWTVIPHDGLNYGTCLDGVIDFAVNSPPVIKPVPAQKVNVGLKFSYDVNSDDDNKDDLLNLKYSLESAPEGMTINSDTGMINWKPTSDQIGTYTVKVLVSDGKDNSSITLEIEVAEKLIQPESSSQIIIITTAGFSILLLILSLFIAGTEVGKYKFFSMVVPMYNKLDQDKVLYNFLRGEIFGFVKAKPGEHYNEIKNSLKLNNGTLSHHARILEKEGYIRAQRVGFYTRFYPTGTKLPDPIDHKQRLIKIIWEQPGIKQREIVDKLNTSQQVVSYHLKKLTSDNLIKFEQVGREKNYYIDDSTRAYAEIQALLEHNDQPQTQQ